ncbi:ABC transporter ATP-binding protein [Idiomarina sp.]|uniref:ABC transporter ATP-binding protein n=1 Tax=Idiomarina sp. TaxID=1874361 RepID=UPI003514D8A1
MTVLSITNLSKSYANTPVLSEFSLNVNGGEVVAVLGENGVGKTTLIRCILGLTAPDAGQIGLFDEQQPSKYRSPSLKQRWGVVMQVGAVNGQLTVHEQITLYRSYYSNPVGIEELKQLLPIGSLLDKRFAVLSGGEQQRVMFALALIGRPQLLFLDEPSVGMDLNTRQQMWRCIESLKSQGVAIILTTHYIEEAYQLADSVVLLRKQAPAEKLPIKSMSLEQLMSTLIGENAS